MNTLANHIFHQPLVWVKSELDNTIKNIRNYLEQYSSDLDNTESLVKVKAELHLLHGSLEMLEFYGAVLVIEDMTKAVNLLETNQSENKEDVFEALLQATLALDAYFDNLHKEKSDIPLTLLPVINDIRAAIKEPLLSESALFLPNLSIVPKTPGQTNKPKTEDQQLCESAISLRPYYQSALLTWYRDPSDQLSLQQIKLVARNLESISLTPRNRQIWWILGGLYEALADRGLKSNVSIRLILGEADRIIKNLCQHKEDIFEKNPPLDLLKNALYYISQSNSNGERVKILKQVYRLDEVIPSEKDLSELRYSLTVPKSDTMISIANELRKTLDQVKATIDNFVRNTPDSMNRLSQVIIPLKHIADTLSLLNFGQEKQILNEQIKKIEEIVISNSPPTKETMMTIAAAMLHIDSGLQHVGNGPRKRTDWKQIKQDSSTDRGEEMSNHINSSLPEAEFRLLVIKVASEARNNILQVKNNILSFLASNQTKSEVLEPIPALLSEVKGSLIISNNYYASSIVQGIVNYVEENLCSNSTLPSKEHFDLFAEAIVSIEYYLEAVAEERTPIEPILEITQKSLSKLGYIVETPKPKTKSFPALEAVVTHISDAPTKAKVNASSLTTIEGNIGSKDANPNLQQQEPIDQEVKEIFIEEAYQELAHMSKQLDVLQLNPTDKEAIGFLRRAYHTLKGSGKIAGAHHISDFSALVDKYAANILCDAISLNKTGLVFLNNSHQLIYDLLESYKTDSSPPPELAALSGQAMHLISPNEAPEQEELTLEDEKEIEAESNFSAAHDIPIQTSFDEEELDSLLESAMIQINIIENFVASCDKKDNIQTPPETLQIAIQELQKCAQASNVKEFIQTTDLLNKYISNICRKNAPINLETIDILSEFCGTTKDILVDLPHLLQIGSVEENQELKEPIESKEPVEDVKVENDIPATIEDTTEQVAFTDEISEPEPETASQFEQLETLPTESNANEDTVSPLIFNEEDIDLIEIFVEEALELIERGGKIIQDHEDDFESISFLSSIQRLLHTIKGSSRMAGATTVGNLSHTLETYIEKIINKECEYHEELIDLIQTSFDAISEMIEDIQSGSDIRTHNDLLLQLDSLSSNTSIGEIGDESQSVTQEAEIESQTQVEADVDTETETETLDSKTQLENLELVEPMESPETVSQRPDAISELPSNIIESDNGFASFDGDTLIKDDVPASFINSLPSTDEPTETITSDETEAEEQSQRFDQLPNLEDFGATDLASEEHQTKTESTLELENENKSNNENIAPMDFDTDNFNYVTQSTETEITDSGEFDPESIPTLEIETNSHESLNKAFDEEAPVEENLILPELLAQIETSPTEETNETIALNDISPSDTETSETDSSTEESVKMVKPISDEIPESIQETTIEKTSTETQVNDIQQASSENEMSSIIEEFNTPIPESDAKPTVIENKDEDNGTIKKSDTIRVDASVLDSIVDHVNEESAINTRLEDRIDIITSNLFELDKAISRAMTQIRDLQFETHSHKDPSSNADSKHYTDLNDLNLNTFSEEEKVAQRLLESLGDIENFHNTLTKTALETDNLLHQHNRVHSQLYEQVLSTRMVTFSVQTQRIQRILRQTCKTLNKKAKLSLDGTDGSIDRGILEALMGPMEHVIRNAIAHGVESATQRKKLNKRETAIVQIKFSKEKSEHVIEISDDGQGINPDTVRKKAIEKGLIKEDNNLSDTEIQNLIFEPGFSTSDKVSQISGRGVGMDVVITEVEKLGGSVTLQSIKGQGSTFTIRLPFTLSRNHTLFVEVGNNTYAIPSKNVVDTFPIKSNDLESRYNLETPSYEYKEHSYPLWYMNGLLNETPSYLPAPDERAYIVLLKHNQKYLALQVDNVNEVRESVLKPSNPQLNNLNGIAGTTVLGNGKIVLIIDVPSLFRLSETKSNKPSSIIHHDQADEGNNLNTLIVDDSITVRKVTERFLNRYGIKSQSAKDGIEALENMELHRPDIILLDIEMPNMDGLQLAAKIKSDESLRKIPIIMITSRTGSKHRQTAEDIGVDVFLGKPYQESDLLAYIQALTGKRVQKNIAAG